MKNSDTIGSTVASWTRKVMMKNGSLTLAAVMRSKNFLTLVVRTMDIPHPVKADTPARALIKQIDIPVAADQTHSLWWQQ